MKARSMARRPYYYTFFAIAGAALFGASTPISKMLIGSYGIGPVSLAALLYLGMGISLLSLKFLLNTYGKSSGPALSRKDIPWLAGSIIIGGIAAPIALNLGLASTPAASSALLLNFECVVTALIAFFFFREGLDRKAWLAILVITVAAALLSVNVDTGDALGVSLTIGSLAIIGACVFWGVDNNFTRNISSKDPLSIGAAKGLTAGIIILALALLLGDGFPGLPVIFATGLFGAICYGISIVLFIVSMRGLGAARASAWFGISPFIGVAVSLALFMEWPGINFFIALPFMAAGAILLFKEEHHHIHSHAAVEHGHAHFPGDVRHDHEHDRQGNVVYAENKK